VLPDDVVCLEKGRETLRLLASASGQREIGTSLHAFLSVALAFPVSYEKDVHFETSDELHGNDPPRQQGGRGSQARVGALAEYDRGRMARAYEALYDAVTRS
jgi:hypothetical protein